MNGVEFRREDYLFALRKWVLIRDVNDGDIRLKDHDFNAQNLISRSGFQLGFFDEFAKKEDSYLRTINPKDQSDENRLRNAQYIKCAVFMNATRHTKSGMSGMVFRTKPIVELGSSIDYLVNNVDGNGMRIVQQVKSTTDNNIAVGRHGLFVDFVSSVGSSSVKDVANGNKAFITEYKAEQIINWKTETFGSINKLSMVVLEEVEEIAIGEFETQKHVLHRVLKLVDGLYVVEVHRTEKQDKQDDINTVETFEPKNGRGQRLDFIPFLFVGSENNDFDIDLPPLYDIAVVNIGHYRNSADVEENSFFASQMTLTATGMTEQWINDVWKGKAQVGSRAVLTGPVGANFGSIQAKESNLALALMEDKQKQMVQLGAKLIEPSTSIKTATQSQIDSADNSSVLSNIADNVEDAYITCISWVQMFMNDSTDFDFSMNKKFGVSSLGAQEIVALLNTWQNGGISYQTFFKNLQKGEIIASDKTQEEEKRLIDSEDTGGDV